VQDSYFRLSKSPVQGDEVDDNTGGKLSLSIGHLEDLKFCRVLAERGVRSNAQIFLMTSQVMEYIRRPVLQLQFWWTKQMYVWLNLLLRTTCCAACSFL
jgi:hypothetical protein